VRLAAPRPELGRWLAQPAHLVGDHGRPKPLSSRLPTCAVSTASSVAEDALTDQRLA
jgi:hypothetical protein